MAAKRKPTEMDMYDEAKTAIDRLRDRDAYEALKKIKRRYPRSASVDVFLFNALDKLGLKEGAQEYLERAFNGWETLRTEAKDRVIDTYCRRVIVDPKQDYTAEGFLKPARFIEQGVRRRLKERLAANPRDVDALRWMGALTAGPESVFYLRLAIEADRSETFARRRLLKHIADRLAFSVQGLPDRWNGTLDEDVQLLDYAEELLVDLEAEDDEEADYWRKMFDGFNIAARDYRKQRKQ